MKIITHISEEQYKEIALHIFSEFPSEERDIDALVEKIKGISFKEQVVLLLRYIQGETFAVIGDHLGGVTSERSRQVMVSALKKITDPSQK